MGRKYAPSLSRSEFPGILCAATCVMQIKASRRSRLDPSAAGIRLPSATMPPSQIFIFRRAAISAVIRRRVQATPGTYELPNGFTVSDRSIRRFFASRHPELIKRARDEEVNPFFVKPGQQLQIDFVEAKFRFAGHAEEETVYIFEATYAWSRKSYVRVCPDMTQASWMISICDCLQKNGIPLEILCDNDKSLVISHGKEHTADMRVWDTVQYGKATTRELYAKERALLRFPEALKTCFDVTCWPARTTDEGIVYVYGTAIHLGPNYRGGQTVYVAVRLNGEVLVTNASGNIIRTTEIPPEN